MVRANSQVRHIVKGLPAVAAMLCLAALFLASSAEAAYEQLPGADGYFGGTPGLPPGGEFSEEVQLGGASAMAVNRTGAGGVPKGTVYVATEAPQPGRQPRVAMFEPKTGGGLKFSEGWAVNEVEEPYERCGPRVGTEEVEGKEVAEHPCPTRAESGGGRLGISINQGTGYVYVFGWFPSPGADQVVVYKADGSEVVTRFAEQAPGGQSVAESPSKVHEQHAPDVLAVNESGEVLLYDEVRTSDSYHRLMVFRPHNGNYDEYEYVGEVAAGKSQERIPRAPVFDEAGNLYVAGLFSAGNHIERLTPETPGAYPNIASPPVCEYTYSKGGIRSMTVDPTTGEVYFFSDRAPLRIRRLGACDAATHKFVETSSLEELAPSPLPEQIYAMEIDPNRQAQAGRPAGELYAASPQPVLSGTNVESALGYVFARANESPPVVETESVSHVTASSAVLRATVNPNFFRTSYAFEYVTEADFLVHGFEGAKEAPIGGSSIEGNGGVQTVTAALGSLAAGTAYRFRVVVSNFCHGDTELPCAVDGTAEEFQTYTTGTPLLPDGRAWELVSQVQKSGGQVVPAAPDIGTCGNQCKPGVGYAQFPRQSTADGEAVAYEGNNFGLGGAAIENEYLARRSAGGWQSVDPTPALLANRSSGYRSITQTLESAVLEQPPSSLALVPGAPAKYANLYTQSLTEPLALSPLVVSEPQHRSAGEFKVRFSASSRNGQQIFFAANDALTGPTSTAPEALDGGPGDFNLYEWHSGQLTLVNVLPGNTETEPGASFAPLSANPVSADGSHVFWSDASGHVYVRIGGTETRSIEEPGKFRVASTDGAKVLLSDGCLYDVGTEGCTDLTEGKGGFEGVVGQSNDLFHVYFVDSEVIDPSPNGEGESAEAGAHNLYAWQNGGTTRFVAQLLAADNGSETTGGQVTDWAVVPANRTAEASPAGRYLAFLSLSELTGRDNIGPCREISGTGVFEQTPCPEAFLYDSETESLVCSSCNPSGARPLGAAILRRISGGESLLQPRYLTDSGRLYFDTRDSLSPLDTNEGTEDVYEWQPVGVGGCASAFADGGCVALLSAGRNGVDSNLLAVDESGDNVFFTTRDRLVGADTDELVDLYDARVGGGFAEEGSTPSCQGETCQTSSAPLPEAPPASLGVPDDGNYKPPKCAKGKVRKKGKCVAKKHGKKRQHHHRKGVRR